jgi:hypothetical protein
MIEMTDMHRPSTASTSDEKAVYEHHETSSTEALGIFKQPTHVLGTTQLYRNGVLRLVPVPSADPSGEYLSWIIAIEGRV